MSKKDEKSNLHIISEQFKNELSELVSTLVIGRYEEISKNNDKENANEIAKLIINELDDMVAKKIKNELLHNLKILIKSLEDKSEEKNINANNS